MVNIWVGHGPPGSPWESGLDYITLSVDTGFDKLWPQCWGATSQS